MYPRRVRRVRFAQIQRCPAKVAIATMAGGTSLDIALWNVRNGSDGVDAGGAQYLHKVGVVGVEQRDVEAARLAVVDYPDVQERHAVEVLVGFGPHLPVG